MKPCPKCLLEELDEKALLLTVQEYVRQLDPRQKVPDDVYAARLDTCTACPRLVSGMCAKCGCYVQLRAAKARLACPDVPARWEVSARTCGTDDSP